MINTQATAAYNMIVGFTQDQTSCSSTISSPLAAIEASNLSNLGNKVNQTVKFVVKSKKVHSQTAFPRLSSPDVSLDVLSYLKNSEIAQFLITSQSACHLKENQNNRLERLIYSQVPIFGRTQYQHFWGVEITKEFEEETIDIQVLRAFLKTYYGPNPVDPTKRVKDTCLIPVVVPKSVKVVGRVFDFNLQLLCQLAKYPERRVNIARYSYGNPALEQHGLDTAEVPKLVLLLKAVIGRKKPWSKESDNLNERGQVQTLHALNAQTEYGCETQPDSLSQTTALLSHYVTTGECAFSNEPTIKNRYTYGRTRESVRDGDNLYQMVSRSFGAGLVSPDGGFVSAELDVRSDGYYELDVYGVGVMRKF